MEVIASVVALAVSLEEDLVEVSQEEVVLGVEVVGFPEASVALVAVEGVVLNWVVQVAAALEAALAEVLDQAKEEVVAQVAVLAPVGAWEVASEEALVIASEA